jgi:EAL and modified HD-GYP domain-containing signal transduction protein
VATLDVVVGRQPILTRGRSTYGFELLFRSLRALTSAEAAGAAGDQMTAEVLFNALSIGIDRLVGDKKLFCNATRGVLTGVLPVLLPPQQTVLEVVESVVPEREVLSACHRLRDEGFELALDDVTTFAEVEPYLELAAYVKVDINAIDTEQLPALVAQLREHASLRLVAEKVETDSELELCESLGFDFLQGFLFARPSVVPGRALEPGRIAQIRLAAHLLDHECPISELEEIIRRDPAMMLQLLQLAGIGAANGMRRSVQSVREALVLVGWRRLQSWISLLLLGGRGQASEEHITIALTRARMCEQLAGLGDRSVAEAAFTVGMVSSYELMLGVPTSEILKELPLDADIELALLDGAGFLGALLADVVDYQTGSPETATRLGLDDHGIAAVSIEALTWAVELATTVAEPLYA